MSTMMSTIVYHVDWDLDPLCPQPRLAKVAARRPRAAENALGRTGGGAGSNLTGGFSGGHPYWMGCCWGAYEPLLEIQFLEIQLFHHYTDYTKKCQEPCFRRAMKGL